MEKVFIINFSRSEYAIHLPVFKALFPSAPFEFCDRYALYEKKISSSDRAVVGCMVEENAAMSAIFPRELLRRIFRWECGCNFPKILPFHTK